jgi:hypothetical protein
MCQLDSEDSEIEEWEPEALPICIELDSPPPRPGHDDAQDTDQSARIIIIDLC